MTLLNNNCYCDLHMTLYQPEIPGNVGTLLRLQKCWGFSVNLIGPLGFILSSAAFRRAHLDYHCHMIQDPTHEMGVISFHKTWVHYINFFQKNIKKYNDNNFLKDEYTHNNICCSLNIEKENKNNISHDSDFLKNNHMENQYMKNPRFILISPHGDTLFQNFTFLPKDHIILGSEGKGFPKNLHSQVHHILRIPMKNNCRSLNLALCGAMIMSKAMNDTNQWPEE